MPNLIADIIETQKPLTYLHTHKVTRDILDQSIRTRKALELDISISPYSDIYIGHPLSSYAFRGEPAPNNLPLDDVLREAKTADLFLMFDVKDVRVLPRVQRAITEYGANRCILHACVKELVFKPFSDKLIIEPHWKDEQLPLNKVLEVKHATNVPLVLCSRGISEEMVANQGLEAITDQILKVVHSNAEVFVPNFPKGEPMPLNMMNTLLDHGILSLFNVDNQLKDMRPDVYFASTDSIENASVI